MKENLFLVALKNPPITFLVDSCDKELSGIPLIEFRQEGLLVVIPTNVDCNIAYVQEITYEDAENIKERMDKRTGQDRIVKPKFEFPKKRMN